MLQDTRLTHLPAIEARVWEELARCARDAGHGWRRAVLATAGEEGADARVVVLREARPGPREVVIYTDTRSPKARQIEQDPRATLVCWCPEMGWQLRLRCLIELADDGLEVTSRWAGIRHRPAAQDYLSPLAPGSVVEDPSAGSAAAPDGTRSSCVQRTHFGVLTAKVQSIDWLEVHAQGHRRARFDSQGQSWLVP